VKTDTLIKHEGFQAIFQRLDWVEAERFIVLLKRDSSDYTEWRKSLWENMDTEELSSKAMDYFNKTNK